MTIFHQRVIDAGWLCVDDGWRLRKKHRRMRRADALFPSTRHRRIDAPTLPRSRGRGYVRAMRQRTGRTTSIEQYRAQGWTESRCDACRGSGKIRPSEYACAANACPACQGLGSWWRSPRGVRCAYPGGEFLPSGDREAGQLSRQNRRGAGIWLNALIQPNRHNRRRL